MIIVEALCSALIANADKVSVHGRDEWYAYYGCSFANKPVSLYFSEYYRHRNDEPYHDMMIAGKLYYAEFDKSFGECLTIYMDFTTLTSNISEFEEYTDKNTSDGGHAFHISGFDVTESLEF